MWYKSPLPLRMDTSKEVHWKVYLPRPWPVLSLPFIKCFAIPPNSKKLFAWCWVVHKFAASLIVNSSWLDNRAIMSRGSLSSLTQQKEKGFSILQGIFWPTFTKQGTNFVNNRELVICSSIINFPLSNRLSSVSDD